MSIPLGAEDRRFPRGEEVFYGSPVSFVAHGEVTMKLIGAGFGRTGTSSLQAALQDLGLNPCYHMREVMRQPEHLALWTEAAEGRPVDWK
ncbi:MAG: sulfotransferase, partial [Archangium sp.]